MKEAEFYNKAVEEPKLQLARICVMKEVTFLGVFFYPLQLARLCVMKDELLCVKKATVDLNLNSLLSKAYLKKNMLSEQLKTQGFGKVSKNNNFYRGTLLP